jgi:hypothetical protein
MPKSNKIKKHPGGRPTKYTPQVIIELNDYLQEAIPENMSIPTVEGIALKLGINKDTLYEWAKKHKEFSDALAKLKMMQKEALVKTGIFGGKEINQAIVGLLLKVNHKMYEQPKVLQQFNIGGKMSVEFIDDESKTVPLATEGSKR